MLTAKHNVYLTPDGKASLESNDGKNTLVVMQHAIIDDHTAKELDIAKLFGDEAKKRAEESEKSSSMLERAKARQDAGKNEKAASPKAVTKTEQPKTEGGSK